MKGRLAAFLLLAGTLWAAEQAPSAVRFGKPVEADWRPSTNLPPGAEYHLVREDPVSHGIQALVRFPSGYSVPPHAHSCSETLVVLSGKLLVAAAGKETVLTSGDYAFFPPGAEHSLKVGGWGRAVFTATTDGAYDLKPTAPAASRP